MKRRMLAALLAAVMLLSLCACGGETAGTQPTPPAQTPEVTPEPTPEVTPEPTPKTTPTPRPTPTPVSQSLGKDLERIHHDASYEREVYSGVYWVSINALGSSRYSNREISAMLDCTPQEKQEKIATLYEALQLYQIGDFSGSLNFSEYLDNFYDYNGFGWEQHPKGEYVVAANGGDCGCSANWLQYILANDYDECGYVQVTTERSGHVYNYIKQGEWYYFIDMTGYRNDYNYSEPGENLYKTKSLQAYVDFYLHKYRGKPVFMMIYTADGVLDVAPKISAGQVNGTITSTRGLIDYQILLDDPDDGRTFEFALGPEKTVNWSKLPNCHIYADRYEENSAPTPQPTPEVTPKPTPAPTPPPVQYDPVEPIDFTKLLSEVSTARREEMASTVTFDGFTDYLVDDPAAKNLLTQEEINALKADHDMPKTLTYAQAVSDVDLYFRALKYGYGAYYYFGGDEVFNKAKDQVLDELAGKNTIGAEQLGEILHENMLFVRDGHFKVYGPSSIEQEDFSYEYFYCQGQEYAKDQNGYYKTLSGEKWYYVSCSNAAVTLQPTLADSGKLVYSPVLFCPVTETDGIDTITLRCGEKTTKEMVNWVLKEAYAQTPMREPDFSFLEENNIAYVSVRNSGASYSNIMVDFGETGLAAKNADIVILDIRSHGGGADPFSKQWIENFTNFVPDDKGAFSTRCSALGSGHTYCALGQERYAYSIFDGAFVENSIPVIVLVDDNCGSSGETVLLDAKTMDNVLVIGSNSGGYQVCGNSMGFSLPNSGIHFSFGASLQFKYDMTNVDGKGYVPDVWCNPKTALEAVLNMVKEYDLADTGGADKIYEALDGVVINHKDITLKWTQWTVNPGSNFGGGIDRHLVTVMVNGVATNDFTVESSNPEMCTCTKIGKGMFELNCTQPGESWLTIICGKEKVTAKFRWVT